MVIRKATAAAWAAALCVSCTQRGPSEVSLTSAPTPTPAPAIATATSAPVAAASPAKTVEPARLGWPADGVIRGVFLLDASGDFAGTLDKLAARGMNAIVLDGKAYNGNFTYASKVPAAVKIGATKRATIPDLAALIRGAHARGIRVVMRNTCFNDPWMARAQPKLAVQNAGGFTHEVGWLDPGREGAREYLRDIALEQIEAGADEIQLDYVRYPVENVKGAVFANAGKTSRPEQIRDFVRSVHELTEARGAKLSVDVFGIVAFEYPVDMRNLGQNIAMLAPECDAISPMVYPSHYPVGYRGWSDPANHPELVDIGTRAAVEIVKRTPNARAVIRPWLQAFPWHVREYGAKYVAAQVKHAENAGAAGWLLWSPNAEYGAAWRAIPPL